MVIYKVRW